MSSYEDTEFVRIMRTGGFVPEVTKLAYERREINVNTALGEQFRSDMRERAASELGIPGWFDFSGEFDTCMSDRSNDSVTEVLMARLYNPSSPVRLGARMALTGLGIISTSQMGKKGYWPTLVDSDINVFGKLVGVGVAEYPYIDPERLRSGEVPSDVQPEPCKGIVALLRRLETRGAEWGELRPTGLVQAVVPLPVDSLVLHAWDR